MEVSVPPIVRGEFVYRDTLLVDVGGDGKRHPRASEAELRTLLTGKAPKDQVWHWYEAQLIHYGLPRSKEKNTAKVRLQQALNAKALKVPPYVSDLETQMKKDYSSAVRKAKAQSKTAFSNDGPQKATSTAGKRKNQEDEPDSAKRTKISYESKVTPKATFSKKDSEIAQSAASPATKKTKASKGDGDSAKAPPKASKTKAAGVTDNNPPGTAPDTPKTAPKPKVKPEAKVKPEPKVKAEPKVKKEPTLKRASPAKKEAVVKDEYDDSTGSRFDTPQQRNVTGVYNLTCPQLEEQLPDCVGNLRMLICVDNDEIWGGFQLAMKSGVIRLDHIELDEQITFGWRA
ncbi:hypothetical protein LTR37_008317 [Vermiconidia calcicola]|uniref:Uncharacterized protein n=1 Tax=Vermiconidia calcicola TaxID=1690605 RepID=A0ACC3NDM9_9PEZI|nr:hypothetical protein LTR37_008317 [Vermiconidia calcicola]